MERWLPNRGRGAYYSKLLLLAKEQKRIDFVPVDPLMQICAYFDIGGAGARADPVNLGCSIRRTEINVLEYYEAQGQLAVGAH